MRAASIPARAPAAPLRSRRLLALAGDVRLVEQVRRGNEAAFEVIFERHAPAILAFCRHMLGTRSHAEGAGVLGCEASRVKGLVFRARSALISRREARETPCESIREQLANLRGGSLRRSELRLHLRDCPGCRAYREQVRQQRRMLAVALPVAPTLGLKSSVLAAIGIGGGSAGGLTAAAGGIGGATVAKLAVAGVLAGGGVVAGTAVVESERPAASAPPATQQAERADSPARGAAGGAAQGE